MALRFTIPGSFDNPDLPVLDVAGYADTFTRPDATTLGTTEFPARPWETYAGVATVQGIVSGEAYVARSTTLTHAIAVADATIADGVLTATMGELVTGSSHGLAFRATDSTNYWHFTTSSTSAVTLQRVVDGTRTSMGSSGGAVRAPGDIMSVVLDGPSIRCFYNGTELITVTDATHQSVTKHGWHNQGDTQNRIRDIRFEPLD